AARVASVLRVAIVGGDLAAGERLVPERIADELGVSRPPVMAAMRQLQREGLVTIGGNGRPYVAGLTPKYVSDLYRFRLLLDEAATVAALHQHYEAGERLLAGPIPEATSRGADAEGTGASPGDRGRCRLTVKRSSAGHNRSEPILALHAQEERWKR